MSSGAGRSKAEQGLADAGNRVTQASQMTPGESSQYQSSFGTGDQLSQLYKYQMGMGDAPSGYLDPTQQFLRGSGEVGQNYYNQILGESKDPYANYQSSLTPALSQAQDTINTYYQRRGLLNSGLAIEGMGRAGVDLAIKDAQARMDARRQSMGEVAGFLDTTRGQSQENTGNLMNLYGQQQQYGQSAMNRQSQGAQAAGQYYSYPYQARLGDAYGRSSALYALPGQTIEAVGNIAHGGSTAKAGA